MKFQALIKNPWVLGGVGLLVIAAGGIAVRGKGGAQSFAPVVSRTIGSEIRISGTVRPSQEVELSFDRSGRIRSVTAKTGMRVFPGQTLVVLENGELAAALARAEANVLFEKARLEETLRGTRSEEVDVSSAHVASAEADIGDARRRLFNEIGASYRGAESAVRVTIDQLLSNPESASPQLNFATEASFESAIESGRASVGGTLSAWQGSLPQAADAGIRSSAAITKENLATVRTFIEVVARAVNSLTPTSALSQSTIAGWRSDISAARANIDASISAVTAAENNLTKTETALELAKRELALKQTPPLPETVRQQQAKVSLAEAEVRAAQSQIATTRIVSPISGVVTDVALASGETVTPGSPVVSIIADRNFQIEAYVPEVDLPEVEIGRTATATLDAYEDASFLATVSAVDPSETIVEGIPTYKVTLHFVKEDSRVKAGMTANVTISGTKDKVLLYVPADSVFEEDGSTYLRVKVGGEVERRKVFLGVKGEGDTVAITNDAVKAGDEVLLPPKK